MRRTARTAALLVALLLGLSSCDMTIRMATRVESDGSGAFTIGFDLDKELHEQLRSAQQAGGDASRALTDLDTLRQTLAGSGWRTDRAEPNGGLVISATRAFDDSAGFDTALDELRAAMRTLSRSSASGSDGFVLNFDYTTSDSLIRSEARFGGEFSFDTGVKAVNDTFNEFIHFEISAQLPGEIQIRQGEGSVREGVVTWRPPVGQRFDYAATATSLKLGTLLALVIPGLILLGLAAGLLLGRTKHTDEEPLHVLDEPVEDLQVRRAGVIADARGAANGAANGSGDAPQDRAGGAPDAGDDVTITLDDPAEPERVVEADPAPARPE